MATILLSAVGAAAGGVLGGGAFGISSAVFGRAIGATLGRAIDQRLMGGGSEVVETGRLDRMRVMGANEGTAIARTFGRMRIPGNVIWTSRFKEKVTVSEQRGGKGSAPKATTKQYSYSISVAVALCEGEVSRIGRIWADGSLIRRSDLNLRVYNGTKDQQPDPLMSAIEGEGTIPAYRGLAYVVIEDMDLSAYGNRVPQLTFEVIRPARASHVADLLMSDQVQGVALMPGSGEYALSTTPVYRRGALGEEVAANVNSGEGVPDLVASLDALQSELPNCRATSLVVSWFGDDLRAGHCKVVPKVENAEVAAVGYGSTPASGGSAEWGVSGLTRSTADVVPQMDGAAVYGGTPSDGSVVEAIAALGDAGQDVMFYPFILMDQLEGNTLPDPWSGTSGQAALPWRGRITSERAVGVAGSTDGTAAARAEVEAFMGVASAADFAVFGTSVNYTGPTDGGYRRFILHYAHLCKAAGGVSAFCVGSEMRGLTQIRDERNGFPAVEALQVLAAEVKAILGPNTKIGYAADWTEYSGYQPQDGSGDLFFPLDPLWADDAIDFVGIDNYMPISDWRDGDAHLDADVGTIYDLGYLQANIRGGEGFDWYYRDAQERALQIRTPIEDGAHGEPWVYRYKDLWGWWEKAHHERVGGVRATVSTPWLAQSKPIWFTELGCAAIDKGTNQPNKFLDPKSSESAIPHFSNGQRDDYMQMQYLRAYFDFFERLENNPQSPIYGGPMVDMSRTFIWAWDARPWPDFPSNLSVWSDGENHVTGHWLTGRTAVMPLAHVVGEICERVGLTSYDVSDLHGVVRGYNLGEFGTPRAALQPLMVAFGFDAIERGGSLVFRNRHAAPEAAMPSDSFVLPDGQDAVIEHVRAPEAEVVGEVRLGYVEAEGEFVARIADARFPHDASTDVTQNDLPLALTEAEAVAIAERWLSEARVARDSVTFAVPPSRPDLQAGDLAKLTDGQGVETLYRIDRVEDRGARQLEAVRVERQIYTPSEAVHSVGEIRPFTVPVPVAAQFMDLPLLTGDEVPHAPHIAVSARPWLGGAAVYSAAQDNGYALNTIVESPSRLGVLQSSLPQAEPGLWQRGAPIRVEVPGAPLSSASRAEVLNGANVAAIGDGSSARWEIIQFAQAELVGPNTYDLSDMLRGQAGSDGMMPDTWPVGSRFVMLDGGPKQIELAQSARDLARHYRVGPSLRPYDDPSFRHYVEAFQGVGLRPYTPAHLKAALDAGDVALSWVRRTRIDGDSWSSVDVPLGEDAESYIVQVRQNGEVMREAQVVTPAWSYTSSMKTQDGVVGAYEIYVAQVSLRFGPGLYARIEING